MEYLSNLVNGIKDTLNSVVNTLNTTKNGIKDTLDGILDTLNTIKETIVVIANAISTISQILGFIGLRVFVLLIMTTLFVWILNLTSPLTKKINYFISVMIVTYIAWDSKLPLQVVIFKYILIMLSPLLITTTTRLTLRLYKIFYRTTNKKITNYITKKSFFSKNIKIPFIPVVSVLFSSGLPTKEELGKIPDTILESEKILLTTDTGRIVFSEESKLAQFVKSCENKDINLLWFWNGHYGANEVVKLLEKIEKIKQTKYIIGNGDNSFILNFLQDKWGWKTIYSNNYINKIEIENKKEYSLKLINVFPIDNGWVIKKRIVATDISVCTIEPVSCNKKILYLSGIVENEVVLYRHLLSIQKYIIEKKQIIESIIIGTNISVDMAKIVFDLDNNLKKHFINIPIFYGEMDYIISNEKCIIEYKNGIICLRQ